MRLILTSLLLITHILSFGQLTDDFSDGDFTNNPTWGGTTADYIVNASNELQLNNTIAATSYLSTPHLLADLDNKEWSLWTRQAFSPSGGNYGRIYLTSSSADLTTDPDGFYLQLGEAGSLDAVRLFKVETGVHTELLAGTAAQIASSFSIGIRVVRDNAGNWSLYIDPAGGTNYNLEGTATDATNLLGTHFGMLNVYTVSNATDFYFDTIYVGNEIVDMSPPVLTSATPINATQVDVLFDEELDQTSAETAGNYSLNPAITVSTAVLDGGNPALVHLTLASAMSNGQSYTLTSDLVADVSLNPSGQQSDNFTFLIADQPAVGDVLINEFMCDPSPQVGLPVQEFVEIYNKSNKIFNVKDWKISDASGEGTISADWLMPGDHMILTSTSGVDSFVVATSVSSFPSLNNSGDDIVLRDSSGLTLDSITYTDDWYADVDKDDGGWSIERINPNDPCSDQSNWAASVYGLGGTPGSENSLHDDTPDTSPPLISELLAMAPNFLQITYNEGMDSVSLANANFAISPTLTVFDNIVPSQNGNTQTLQFVENIQASQLYNITISNISDCWLNNASLNGQFALPEMADVGDVVINEILFNPVSGGKDWVEFYNSSDKLIDLYNWEIADYDNDTIDNHKLIEEHVLLYPDEYIVFGEDTAQIVEYYPMAIPNRYVQMDLPSWSNDSGSVYLIAFGNVMDHVSYSDDWHFALLDSDDGVTLERIDAAGNSNDSYNWHSAAEAVGFGTPGGENSQYNPAVSTGEFNYTDETISPDNDGFEDILQINYQLTEVGFVGTFRIYDDRGRFIATVMDAELLSTEGSFTWDGIRDDNTKASIGIYVGVFEAFNINTGSNFAERKAFVVAGNLD